jgi:hypothetical protein
MTAFEIADAIQSLGPMTYIRESGYTYPMIMSAHLACIAVFGGLILMTDLRLLGLALTDVSVTDVVKGTRPWKHLGGLIIITMGLLLGTSEADKYYNNPYFWIKMMLLFCVFVHAMVFRKSVYKNTEAIDRAGVIPPVAKTAAVLSLIIWIGIPSAGRWIAYYEAPKKPIVRSVSAETNAPVGDPSASQPR